MSEASSWFISPMDDSNVQVRLYCFPHAGGAASAYHPWRRPLGPEIGLYAVQLPGRENRIREAFVNSIGDVATVIAREIASNDRIPTVLFGHSMGALLAFESAQVLHREGIHQPATLVVSGRVAPQLTSRAPRVAHLPPDEVVRIIEERYQAVPAEVLDDRELRKAMGATLRADMTLVERYESGLNEHEPLDCSIVAFGGSDDPWVSRTELDAWEQQTSGAFSCLQLRGDHFYFRDSSVLQALLTRLRAICLETI